MAVNLNRSFVMRKLFQLSGILPLGVFLLEHFYTNSKAVAGAAAYNESVQTLQEIPYVLLLEIFGIFLPLVFHGVYGMKVAYEARLNNVSYPFARNTLYTVQRFTGVFLFFFILFHVLNFRFGLMPGLNTEAVAHNPDRAFQIVQREMQIPWVVALYVAGTTAAVWHLAHGLWLFLVDWGVVIGARAQRYVGYACLAGGVALLAVGLNSLFAFIWEGGLTGQIL